MKDGQSKMADLILMKNSHLDRTLRYFLTSLNHDLTSLKDELFVLESIPADFGRCSKCEGGCFRKLIPLSGPILALEQVIMQSKFLFQCGGGGGKSEEPLNPSRDIF